MFPKAGASSATSPCMSSLPPSPAPDRAAKPGALIEIYDLFPGLLARRQSPGGLLSGGEQQMLAIGRALMTAPSLLILDEATEGLAPLIRERIWAVLAC